MQRIKSFFQLLIVSNIWIALCSVCFLLANCILLDIPLKEIVSVACFVGSSTLFIYQLSRYLYQKRKLLITDNNILDLWINNHLHYTKLSILISSILSVFFFIFLNINAKILMIFIGCISCIYPIPLPIKNIQSGHYYRLRDFPFLKIFLIAFTWASTAVWLPAVQIGTPINPILFTMQFLFIFFITIPFDINDIKIDAASGVKTLPIFLGKHKTNYLLTVVLIFIFGLHFFFNKDNLNTSNYSYFISILIFYGLLYYTAIFHSKRLPKWLIMFIFDGSMILYFILIFIFKTVLI